MAATSALCHGSKRGGLDAADHALEGLVEATVEGNSPPCDRRFGDARNLRSSRSPLIARFPLQSRHLVREVQPLRYNVHIPR